MIDFSSYKKGDRFYSGSERKESVLSPDGQYFMLKFPKLVNGQKTFSHISEYLGSRIFQLAGLDAQEVYLGMFNGEQVVACRDFNEEDLTFVPFNGVGESSLDDDRENYSYTYADIMRMLHDNVKLTNVDETVSAFWRMYIVDALLGNFDRHSSNWGFLKKGNTYTLAPIFDNGSCLFPRLINDKDLESILTSKEELNRRVFEFPTSKILLGGQKSSYYEVIHSCQFDECNQALVYVVGSLQLNEVHTLIESIEWVSDVRRRFLHRMIDQRYDEILVASYERLRM